MLFWKVIFILFEILFSFFQNKNIINENTKNLQKEKDKIFSKESNHFSKQFKNIKKKK